MSEKTFIDKIYDVQTSAAMRDTYDQWADSYEAELTQHHYRTPTRVAQALARHLPDLGVPILDFACGTGLSGQALNKQGFTCIDGIDLSEGMIAQARKKNVYRHLNVCRAESPFDAAVGPYSAITAVGAIGAGAAPVECLSAAIDYLAPNALFCVSLNDHTLEDASYEQVLQTAVKAGTIRILEDEYGEHLPNIGLKAKIFVVQKL
ncbi:MAG: methyltransferase domain-containing protein [Orrella sp.]